ncbi:MAG: ACT domain-containing protein [bacterium]
MSTSESKIWLKTDVVKIVLHDVPDRPGMAADIFQAVSQAGINVDLVVQTARYSPQADISLVVNVHDADQTVQLLKKLSAILDVREISRSDDVALIVLEMDNLSKIPGIAARMFHALADQQINIELISSSMNSIECLIALDRASEAQEALTREFSAEL